MQRRISPPGNQPDGTHWPVLYSRLYVSTLGGGTVYRPAGWRESREGREITISRHLADNGYQVVLLKTSALLGDKTPDAAVLPMARVSDDAEFWEFKRLTAQATNAQEFAQRGIREGKKQAPTIVLYLSENITEIGGMASVNRGILNALRYDVHRNVQRVVVLDHMGWMWTLRREELEDGQRFPEL